ncbi:MAG: DegT/DnrJ/EryC1/StrS family aminotransferase [Candidatus Planktophila sp.]|nr:DegT/DnrJ/EryC1/StrS family aminotransferase [Candidatus Planktophila sp.]
MNRYGLASSTWGDEEIEAIQSVIRSGRLTMGARVEEFETEFAKKLGGKYAVMVNSGSSANLALLTAARYRNPQLLSPGDEVIVPAVSWSTTYFPVNQAGFSLKFVDIDPDSLNIDVNKVQEAIGPKTKAIFAVNLLGNCADWDSLQSIASENDLQLLEDNCESLGARIQEKNAGTFGIGGTFSTFFSHHISTMEGGVILTDDEPLFHTLKSIRAHGWTRDLPNKNHVHNKSGENWDDFYRFVLPGYNLRPLEIEAAIGVVQLKKLPEFIKVRRANALRFLDLLRGIEGFKTQKEHGESSWFGFSLILDGKLRGYRRELLTSLTDAGIESRPIVTGNFTRNPVVTHLDHAPIGALPSSDEVHDNGLFVGNHHYDMSKELDLLANTLLDFSRRY